MSDFKAIVCINALRDGLNPCMLMACAVFILLVSVLPAKAGMHNPSHMAWQRVIFVLFYAAGVLVYNFGPFQLMLLSKSFIFTAKILYFILGLGSFILGVLFFKDWILLGRGDRGLDQTGENIKPAILAVLAIFLLTVILAAILSALATLCPIDNYVMMSGNAAILKGQGKMVMPQILSYIFISLWPLWLVWVFLSIKNIRPSLLKIVSSSIFFAASSCVIFIFLKN